MNEILHISLAFIGGVALGTLFFGGLWFTIKKAVTAKLPALWLSVSFIVRAGLTLGGLYGIGMGSLKFMLIGVLGFFIARFLVIHLTKIYDEKQSNLKMEDSHET